MQYRWHTQVTWYSQRVSVTSLAQVLAVVTDLNCMRPTFNFDLGPAHDSLWSLASIDCFLAHHLCSQNLALGSSLGNADVCRSLAWIIFISLMPLLPLATKPSFMYAKPACVCARTCACEYVNVHVPQP